VIEKTAGRWFEADIYRMADEIALKSPDVDTSKAEAYFERALTLASSKRNPGNSAPQ
jgi:hypothetical protein